MSSRAKRRSKKKVNWLLRIMLVAGAAFLILHILQSAVQLSEKYKEVQAMDQMVYNQGLINEALSAQLDHTDEICEQKANEEGMYKSGQQIFQRGEG